MATRPVLISTMGRTAAGKTTLAKYIVQALGYEYISEALIKRQIRGDYSSSDSLDETLRDKGYELAIAESRKSLKGGHNTLIDASFHKRFRREWLYKNTEGECSVIIFLYCCCPNEQKVVDRIRARKIESKNAENQADTMGIYNFINQNFDEPNILAKTVITPLFFIHIDTDKNIIVSIQSNSNDDRFVSVLDELKEKISQYLNFQKELYDSLI